MTTGRWYHAALASLQGFPSSAQHLPHLHLSQLLLRCKTEKTPAIILRLHLSSCETGLDAHILIRTYLVSLLSCVGKLRYALRLFNTLIHRTEPTWDIIITGCINAGKLQFALTLYKKMQEDFLCPSVHTYMALLKACSQLHDVEMGSKIHSEMAKQSFIHRDPFIGSALVDMYAKCGLLAKAREILNNLPVQDVVSWTALISGYVKHGYGEEALDCFEQMQREEVIPNTVTYICIFKACSIVGAIDKGDKIHAEISKQGLGGDIRLASTLVDMYAKSGWFSKAQEVIDKLHVPDVVPWTCMIAGYCRHGHGEEALNCFKHMQLQGAVPDANTYVCSLKACGCIRSTHKGKEMHALIVSNGLGKEDFIGNALINMYMNCGLVHEAQGVFNKLPIRNVVSWTSLIQGYTEHDYDEDALNCFKQMQHDSVSPDIVTFLCTLKACGNIGASGTGQQIHAEIARRGFLRRDNMMGNALIEMYSSCGLLEKAHEVFEKLSVQDIISWTVLIAGYIEQGQSRKALSLYETIKLNGISPDEVTYCCALKACGNLGIIEKGEEIHADIKRKGLLEDVDVGGPLVEMYAKCGSFDKAFQVINQMCIQDSVLWNALISGFVKNDYNEEALRCFFNMKSYHASPDVPTYVFLLRACGCLEMSGSGQEIHAEVIRKGWLSINSIESALVDMYAKCGSFAEAEEVFGKMHSKDLDSLNALIRGYAKHGLCQEALNCFQEMQLMQLSPNASTLACMLKACISTGSIEAGQVLHSDIARRGLERVMVIGNALIDMYANFALFSKALEVLDTLLVRDVISWTTLIAGFVNHGLGEEALTCFEQMQYENVSPDAVTFVCSLSACSIIGTIDKGFAIHSMISSQKQLQTDPIIGNVLVDMYSNCGLLIRAQEIFDNLVIHDIISWTSLITGYAHVGDIENAFYNFERMIREGTQPNLVTCIAIVNACSHAGVVDIGLMFFELMNKGYSAMALPEVYNCIVDLLGRAGQLNNVIAMIEIMPFHPDIVAWHTLMGACKKWSDVELGTQAFEHIKHFGVPDAAAYICISNIYVKADI